MSFLNQLPASTTIQPIPEDAATISAATSVEYATPLAVLNPTKISAAQEGKITLQNTCIRVAPTV